MELQKSRIISIRKTRGLPIVTIHLLVTVRLAEAQATKIDGRSRKVYFVTRYGKKTWEGAGAKVHELFDELFEGRLD